MDDDKISPRPKLQHMVMAMRALEDAEWALQSAAEHYDAGADELYGQTVDVMARAYVIFDQNHKRVDEARKELYAGIERLGKGRLPEAMLRAKVRNTTIDIDGTGYTVSRAARTSVSMIGGQKSIDYLKNSQDPNYRALVQETVNSQTLSAFAKDLLETKGKELPDDLFKSSPSTYTSVRKK